MEEKRSRYKSPGWLCAKERIGHLVRDNYRVDQEMSPRLAALRIKALKFLPRCFRLPAQSKALAPLSAGAVGVRPGTSTTELG